MEDPDTVETSTVDGRPVTVTVVGEGETVDFDTGGSVKRK